MDIDEDEVLLEKRWDRIGSPVGKRLVPHLLIAALTIASATIFGIAILPYLRRSSIPSIFRASRSHYNDQLQEPSLFRSSSVSSHEPFVVKGVQTGFTDASRKRPLRINILQFQDSGPAFDLYVQCFEELMDRQQEDPLSHYQIASIHGKPYRAWNDMKQTSGLEYGYCPHSSVLFPVWHRPYVAMYEQLICECAMSLASNYPDTLKSDYQAAALSLRLPYWDWAINHSLPEIFSKPTCAIRRPNGVEEVRNPLYRYEFHPVPGTESSKDDKFVIEGFDELQYTVRNIKEDGLEYVEEIESWFGSAGKLAEMTYQTLTSLNESFTHFSNKAAAESSGVLEHLSIENIHNQVHSLIKGHMSSNYAAYDPIFWLHHANIDRILALWQALYPNSYVVPQLNNRGSYTIVPGTVDDIDSPLMPFAIDDSGVMHTARTVRRVEDLGYSYPELDFVKDEMELAAHVERLVTEMYGNPELWTT